MHLRPLEDILYKQVKEKEKFQFGIHMYVYQTQFMFPDATALVYMC